MILNPNSSSANSLDTMMREREDLRKDVVYSDYLVKSLGVGQSHLFRPYRALRSPPVTFKTKLVHRWPNLPGPIQKGVKFSSIPRGCGENLAHVEDSDAVSNRVDARWLTSTAHGVARGHKIAGTAVKSGSSELDSAYWMTTHEGNTWAKSTDQNRIRTRQKQYQRLSVKADRPPHRSPPLLPSKTCVNIKAGLYKSSKRSWSMSNIGLRLEKVIVGSTNEPGPATFSEPVTVKGALPTYKADDYSTIASTTRRINRMKKVITSPFKCKIPQLASLDKGVSQFVQTQKWIESQVRAKHRRSEDKRRLLRVQKKHQNLYENILSNPGERPKREVQKDEFKPRPRWEIPFRITDSYESPFHKVTHKSRNFTNVSPIKGIPVGENLDLD